MQKWQKILILVLGTLFLAAVVIRINLEDILVSRLNQLINQDKDRLYNYHYNKLEVNVHSGNISLSDLKFQPRKRIIDSLDQLGQAKEKIFQIELDEFKLEGLGILSFLLDGTIRLDEITFSSPMVTIYENVKYKPTNPNSSDLNTEKEFFSDVLSSGLKEAQIGVFAFENARIKIYKIDKDTSLSLSADSSNFFIKGIVANEKSLKSKEIFYYDSSAIDLKRIEIYSIEEYKLELGRFYKSSTKEDVYFSNVLLSPNKDKESFMLHQEYQTEWFKFLVKEIVIQDLDITEYQKSRNINAKNVNINGIDLEIYKDKRLKKKKAKYKPLLNETIRNIKIPINIQFIQLNNANIDYQELENNAEEPLHVYFRDMRVHFSNFSTDSISLAKNDSLAVHMNGTFMKEGKLTLNLSFLVLDSLNSFNVKGELKEQNLNELNPILKNSAFIMFTDGYLNHLEFKMNGNNHKITGDLDIDYKGLNNLQVLRKKDEMDQRKKKGKREKSDKALLSFLASNIAPVDYNKQNKHYHRGNVNFDRDQSKSIFHLIVNGLKTGVFDSFLHNHEGFVKKMKEKKEKQKKTN